MEYVYEDIWEWPKVEYDCSLLEPHLRMSCRYTIDASVRTKFEEKKVFAPRLITKFHVNRFVGPHVAS